jgi:hypothetical protein
MKTTKTVLNTESMSQSSSSLNWAADADLAVLDRAFLTLAGI